ncbi:MAG: lysophospholipid acyltransferase family protein, partial [Candidatus Omnitrophica bacterium]|nr:lysophospholipid acyltransferase family protein [Candidatus Omnitrophota bacterium]
GGVFLSSHIGNWELGAAVISSLGYEIYALALDHDDKKINKFFVRQRKTLGVGVIALTAALKKCTQILRRNKLLGILGDRDFTKSGIMVNFFGKETVLPKGPAFFSLRTGAPIVMAIMVRTKGDRYLFVLEKPLTRLRRGNPRKDMESLMAEYLKLLEKYIRRYPDQWYVFKRVWNTV